MPKTEHSLLTLLRFRMSSRNAPLHLHRWSISPTAHDPPILFPWSTSSIIMLHPPLLDTTKSTQVLHRPWSISPDIYGPSPSMPVIYLILYLYPSLLMVHRPDYLWSAPFCEWSSYLSNDDPSPPLPMIFFPLCPRPLPPLSLICITIYPLSISSFLIRHPLYPWSISPLLPLIHITF